ncbi:prepilin peptidase [Atopobacter phocae]|uniref:prepilin peptidase n=1 Tax=Atopobacter phocae TaxID=136492 RepID=UPI003CCC089D
MWRRLTSAPSSKFSYCNHCYTQLSFLDMIPVLSFLCLKGRCRYCCRSLPTETLFGELLTGYWSVFIYLFFNSSVASLSIITIGYILIITSIFDLIQKEIPDIFWGISFIFTLHPFPTLTQWNTAFILIILMFFILYYIPGYFEGADFKALIILCLILPFPKWALLNLIASGLGLLYQLFYFLFKKHFILELPFIPFITVAFMIIISCYN